MNQDLQPESDRYREKKFERFDVDGVDAKRNTPSDLELANEYTHVPKVGDAEKHYTGPLFRPMFTPREFPENRDLSIPNEDSVRVANPVPEPSMVNEERPATPQRDIFGREAYGVPGNLIASGLVGGAIPPQTGAGDSLGSRINRSAAQSLRERFFDTIGHGASGTEEPARRERLLRESPWPQPSFREPSPSAETSTTPPISPPGPVPADISGQNNNQHQYAQPSNRVTAENISRVQVVRRIILERTRSSGVFRQTVRSRCSLLLQQVLSSTSNAGRASFTDILRMMYPRGESDPLFLGELLNVLDVASLELRMYIQGIGAPIEVDQAYRVKVDHVCSRIIETIGRELAHSVVSAVLNFQLGNNSPNRLEERFYAGAILLALVLLENPNDQVISRVADMERSLEDEYRANLPQNMMALDALRRTETSSRAEVRDYFSEEGQPIRSISWPPGVIPDFMGAMEVLPSAQGSGTQEEENGPDERAEVRS